MCFVKEISSDNSRIFLSSASSSCALLRVTISGIFCAGGDSKFGLYCDCISMWCIMVSLGLIAAFVLKLPVIAVYFVISLDEFVKIPAVYLNYKKYRWVKDLTVS